MLIEGNLTLVLTVLFGLVVVAIVAILIWLISLWLKPKQEQDVASPPQKPPKTPIPVPSSAPVYLLAVRRTPLGEWDIQVEGQRYRSLEAVPEDEVRQEVLSALRELATFARGYVQSGGQPTPARRPASPSPEATPSASMARRLPTDARSATIRASGPPSLMPTINLAEEIGEIVDEMLEDLPALAGRSIRLHNAPEGGVLFAVDGKLYHDVAEIPDQAIQELIRRATKEWERR